MTKHLTFVLFFLGTQLFSQQNEEQLTATIIGSGSPKFNTERSGPSVLISYKNTKILVDMGNGTQANLHKNNTKIKDIDGLLFTHHHLDHNEEFAPIFIQSLLGGNKTSIAGPEQTMSIMANILENYKEDIDYRLSKSGRSLNDVISNITAKNLTGNTALYIGDIKITYTPVNHTIETLAYRFEAGNQSIVISGDLIYSKSLPVLAKNADYLIIDSGGAITVGSKNKTTNNTNTKQKAHVNLAESSQMAQEAQVKNLVLTHFNVTDIDEEATSSEIKKNYTGTILYATDLMILPLNNVSSTVENGNTNINYPIVDTGITDYYSNVKTISKPSFTDVFYGQDANYQNNQPSYSTNNNGTITDNITGLIWEENMGFKITYTEALLKAENSNLGGYSDWRIPTIKELYSLILFTGKVKGDKAIKMFINTDYFTQPLGNTNTGEREIDAQTWTSTPYAGKTMKGNETIFGVNFVDGRIKGYPKYNPKKREENKMYFRMVRGNIKYGRNNFIDNNDGTVSDLATGLMWQKTDDGIGRDWEESLAYSKNLDLAGYSDWHLPNAKELQSIVDYSKSPQTTNSPAIDPIFNTSAIKDPNGKNGQYPYFWTSTTHLDGKNPMANAVYIAFGEAQGEMNGNLMDVHGAGAQRSDPKSGDKSTYPQFFGPQGDVRYVYNYTRAVRSINSTENGNVLQPAIQQPEQNQKVQQAPQKSIQNTNTPPSFENMLKKMDSNKDGKLSKSEVKGKLKENFDRRDTNKDGYITEDEMTGRRR